MKRFAFIFAAFYIIFLGGGTYYQQVFQVRVFHHIFITVTLALWLVLRLRSRDGLPRTPLNVPLYVAVTVWFASAAFSIDRRMAFENVWF